MTYHKKSLSLLIWMTFILFYLFYFSSGFIKSMRSGRTYAQQVERLLNESETRAFAQVLSRRLVWIQRAPEHRRGVHRLINTHRTGQGLWITPTIIITADRWTVPVLGEVKVYFEVSCTPKRQEVSTATIKYRDPALGLAALSIPTPLSCWSDPLNMNREESTNLSVKDLKERPTLQRVLEWLKPQMSLFRAQGLYVYEPPPRRPARVVIHQKGQGQLAYYWIAQGVLLEGAPLFDTQGRWITSSIGVIPNFGGETSSLSSLILPRRAVQQFIKDLKTQLLKETPQ